MKGTIQYLGGQQRIRGEAETRLRMQLKSSCLDQKVPKEVNGRAPSARTSQGSYSTSPLKDWQCTPRKHMAALTSLSRTSEMGSYRWLKNSACKHALKRSASYPQHFLPGQSTARLCHVRDSSPKISLMCCGSHGVCAFHAKHARPVSSCALILAACCANHGACKLCVVTSNS